MTPTAFMAHLGFGLIGLSGADGTNPSGPLDLAALSGSFSPRPDPFSFVLPGRRNAGEMSMITWAFVAPLVIQAFNHVAFGSVGGPRGKGVPRASLQDQSRLKNQAGATKALSGKAVSTTLRNARTLAPTRRREL